MRETPSHSAHLYGRGWPHNSSASLGGPDCSLGMEKHKNAGLIGLYNLGNTCYMNSALQCLIHMQPLQKYFRKCRGYFRPRGLPENSAQFKLVLALTRLFDRSWSGRAAVESPRDILVEIAHLNPMFQGFGQHDSQEFLSYLLDVLHETLLVERLGGQRRTASEIFPDKNHEALPPRGDDQSGGEEDKDYENNNNEGVKTHSKKRNRKKKKPKPPAPFVPSSPIAEVFAGRLASSIQCLNCLTISRTYDVVHELNLPLPCKGDDGSWPQVTKTRAGDYPSSTEGASSNANGGGLGSYIFSMIKSVGSALSGSVSGTRDVIWGRPVDLSDCLRKFFSVEELRDSEKYACEKCKSKQDGEKRLLFESLPHVLCLHLKRFRYEAGWLASKNTRQVSFPVESYLDIRGFVDEDSYALKEEDSCYSTSYQLVAVIEHVGSYSGGHYTAFCYSTAYQCWFHFDDGIFIAVDARSVANSEPYYLFYERVASPKRTQDRASIKRETKKILIQRVNGTADADVMSRLAYVPRHWYYRFMNTTREAHMSADGVVCPHGRISAFSSKQANDDWKAISCKVATTLAKKYSCDFPFPKTKLDMCPICEQAHKLILGRRSEELTLIQEFESAPVGDTNSDCWYLVSTAWIQKWKRYIHWKRPYSGFTEALESHPGPVDNSDLLRYSKEEKLWVPRAKRKSHVHYISVNASVWRTFKLFHGGGPTIARTDSDIYSQSYEAKDEASEAELLDPTYINKYRWETLLATIRQKKLTETTMQSADCE